MKIKLLYIAASLLLTTLNVTAQTAPLLYEDFNSTPTTGALPDGWDTCRWVHGFSSVPTANYMWKSEAGGINSTRCAYLFANQSYTLQHGLLTPARHFSSSKVMKLSFDLKNYTTNSQAYAYLGGELDLLVTYDNGATIADTIALGINTGTRWQHYEYPLTRQVGASNVRILFLGMSDHHYYLDNVCITEAPQCKPVSNIYLSSLTSTGASFFWYIGAGLIGTEATPNSFLVKIYNADTDSLISTSTAGADMTFTAVGLTPATRYRLSILSDCGATLGTADAVDFLFQTLATPAQLPYLIDFDSNIPAGSFGSNYEHNTNAGDAKGAGSLKMTTSLTDNARYVTPVVAANSDSLEVDLLIKPSVSNVTVHFGVLSNPYDDGTFDELSSITTSTPGVWQSVRFNTAAAYESFSPSMICIFIDNGTVFNLYVDSIHIHPIPSCLRPENLVCTARTHNSVTLAWNVSTATNYQITATHGSTIVYQQIVAAPTGSYTVTGLTPNTNYLFAVKALCSTTDESETKQMADSIRTLCDVADTVLMFDGAEAGALNYLPDCWTTGILSVGTGSGSSVYTDYPFIVNTTHHTGTKGFQLRNMKSGTVSYLSSQQRDFGSQAGAYTLRLWVNRTATTMTNEGVDLWITQSEGDTTTGDHLGMINRYYAASPVEGATGWYRYDYIINHTGLGYITIIGKSANGAVTSFDDIEVMSTPTCPYIKSLTPYAPTDTSITFTWLPGGTEQQWLVGYTATSSAAPTLSDTLVVTTPSYTISNLAPAVNYTLNAFVRALCSPGNSAEAIAITNHSFTTACSLIDTLPYRMGFEDDEIYVDSSSYYYPKCWTRYSDYRGTQPKFRHVPYINKIVTPYARTGSNAVYGQVSDETAYNSIMLLPQIDTTAFRARDLRLKFWVRESISTFKQSLYIGVMSDPTDLNTWVVVDTIFVATTDWTEYRVPFDRYQGNGSYIGINFSKIGLVGSVSYTYVDDLTLELNPHCYDIDEGIKIDNLSDTTVTITLLDTIVNNSWQYAIGTAGTPLNMLIPVDVSSPTAVINGLTAETSYDIYVRSSCGVGQYGYWTEATSFSTTRTPATMPYTCGFENGAEDSLWSFSSLRTDCYNFIVGTNAAGVYSGSKALYVTNGTATGAYTYPTTAINGSGRAFASRVMNFSSAGYQVNLRWKATGGQSTNDYGRIFLVNAATPLDHTYQQASAEFNIPLAAQVDTGITFVSGTSLCTALNISTYSQHSPDANGWCNLSYYLDMTGRAGTYNFVVMWNQDASGGRSSYPLAVDDISIVELSCIPPSSVDVVADAYSADFAINQPDASQWEIAVDTLPVISSSSSSVTVNGLNANTLYSYTIRTICAPGDTSAWRKTGTFQTLCAAAPLPYSESFETERSLNCWSTLFPTDTSYISRSLAKSRTGAASLMALNSITVSPEIDVDSLVGCQLTGFVYSTADSVSLSFMVGTDRSESSSFSDPVGYEFIPAKGVWREFTIFFDSLASPDYEDFRYGRFIAIYGEGHTFYFDDIRISHLSSCRKPNHLDITNVGEYQFDISFMDNAAASRWLVATSAADGYLQYDTITSTTATILVPYSHTLYTVRVAAICSDSSLSEYAEAGTVLTLCDGYDLPYTCGFETSEGWSQSTSYVEGQAEAVCWATLNIKPNGANYPEYRSITTRHSGSRGLYAYSTSPVTKEGFLILPEFNAPTNRLKVEYYGKTSTTTTTNKKIELGYMTDITDDSSFVLIAQSTNHTTFAKYEYDLSTYAGIPANARLVFRISRKSGGIYIDDLVVSRILLCQNPAPATLVGVTANSATFVATDTVALQYVCVRKGISPSRGVPQQAGDTVVVTGLADNTEYDFYLRALCDSSETSDWVHTQFTTSCLPYVITQSTPFLEDFESYAYGTILNGSSCYDAEGEGTASSYRFKVYPTTLPSASATAISYYAHDSSHLARCGYIYTTSAASPAGAELSRDFSLDSGKTYKLSAFFRGSSVVTSATNVSFLLRSANTADTTLSSFTVRGKNAPATFIDDQNRTVTPYNTQYRELQAYFTVPTRGIYTLAIRAANASSSNATFYCYFDDWSLCEFNGIIPPPVPQDTTCETPQYAPTLVGTSKHSISASFDMLGRDSIMVGWAPYVTGLSDADITDSLVSTSPNFTITGLESDSSYAIFARYLCGGTLRSDWSPYLRCATQPSLCLAPSDLRAEALFAGTATFVVTRSADTLQYGLSPTSDPSDIISLAYAYSDTIRLYSLLPETQYYLFVRTVCDSVDFSPWTNLLFRTPAAPLSLPYVCGFESAAESAEWSFASGRYGWFVAGNAVSNGGSRSLYVTDLGSRYYYSSPGTPASAHGTSYAYIPLAFGADTYEVEFDWLANGEPGLDYGRALLAPASVALTPDILYSGLSSSSLPQGWIDLGGGEMGSRSAWGSSYAQVTFTDSVAMYLIFLWHQNHTGDYQSPLAIDNISVRRMTCPPLTSLTISAMADSAFVRATLPVSGGQVWWHLSSDPLFSDTLAMTVTDSTLTLSGLTPNTLYYLRSALLCGSGDTSHLRSDCFRTQCTVISAYPYSEGFEAMQPNISDTIWYRDNCWSHLSTSSIAYSYPSTISGYVHSGNQGLFVYNGITTATQHLLMPEMHNLNGKTLTFYHKASSSDVANNTMTLGYYSNNNFVLLHQFLDKPLDWSLYTSLLTGLPSDARLAFRFEGPYTYYLDDIRINEIAQGSTYSDTICFNAPYNRHGFTFAAGALFPGDTSFTRLIPAVTPGVADSITTVNIHVRSEIAAVAFDTICANTPVYIWGRDTIYNPTTAIHTQVFAASCGCDSTVALSLYVVPATNTLNATICQGDSLVVGGSVLHTAGTYNVNETTPQGCTVVTTVNLSVIDSLNITAATICQSGSYTFHGRTFTQPGIYDFGYISPAGCSVTDRLVLAVDEPYPHIYDTICHGQTYYYYGQSLTAAGTYQRTYVSTAGCDITETLHLAVTTPAFVAVSDNACEGHPYYGYGIMGLHVYQDTVVAVTSKTLALCDSLTEVHLHFIPTVSTEFYASIARGEIYHWNGTDYTEPGDYTATFTTVEGCDSVVTLHLSVGSSVEEIDYLQVEVVPNPAKSGEPIYISMEGGISITSVDIINSTGEIIDCTFSIVNSQLVILNSHLPSGIYFVRITTDDNKVSVRKLIVK